MKTYCPTCQDEVEVIKACGAVSYFCNTCNELKSSKVVLTEEELEELKKKDKN